MCGFARPSLWYVYLTLLAFVWRLTLINIDVDGFSNRVSMGGLRGEYYTDIRRLLILQELQSILAGKYAVSNVALYVRALPLAPI